MLPLPCLCSTRSAGWPLRTRRMILDHGMLEKSAIRATCSHWQHRTFARRSAVQPAMRENCSSSISTPLLSDEDLVRTQLYAQERARDETRRDFASLDQWLLDLQTVVRFERLAAHNLPRATQLLNKTNQMNLRTRRLTEPEFWDWSQRDGHEVWAVTVRDHYGDAGLTGILGLEHVGTEMLVSDYVLSCRVMGRRVEETLLWFAVGRARAAGASVLCAHYEQTAKNKPCLTFWEGQSALSRNGNDFLLATTATYEQPAAITVESPAALV